MGLDRQDKVELTNMCMIYDDRNNVVVEKKITSKGIGLIFPGGHVENRESLVDSVCREIYEETGLTILNPQLCGVKDWVEADGSRYMVFLYKTNQFKGEIRSSDEGEICWMSLEELKKRDLLWHLEMMLHIFEGEGCSELYFDRNGLLSVPVLK